MLPSVLLLASFPCVSSSSKRNRILVEHRFDRRRLRGRAAFTAPEQHQAVTTDFRRVALVAVLVVPLPRLQATLDVNLLALREVFGQRLRGLSPEYDAMPFGFLLALAGFVVPHFRGCEVQRCHCSAAR